MIKAIDTYYNGNYFRSRLEARWAVYFDAAGIKYQYEPEGYVLPNGQTYLPDFYLPGLNLYAEVKPDDKGYYASGVLNIELLKAHLDYSKWRQLGKIIILIGNPHDGAYPFISQIGAYHDADLFYEDTGRKLPDPEVIMIGFELSRFEDGLFWELVWYVNNERVEGNGKYADVANKTRFEHKC